ncbi:MAG: endonuclease/exonuclease/phosphatase family protein [Gammaproteobacteria bacterium]|nr:endonuclease/exonuclease/phosphatase family protein [Gammaproteobacteria bacterium]
MMKKSLRIVTYNIHKGFRAANLRFVLPQMREALQKLDADLVFLQEIQGKHEKKERRIANWPAEPQFEFLARKFWPHYIYGKNALYRDGHHGNAILSKFEFLEWENIDVSKYKRSSRSMLHGVVAVPGLAARLHLICIHFALFKTERAKQLSILKTRILEHVPEDEPLIIAGDFNDWRGQAEHYLEAELGLKEVFKITEGQHAKTFPSWNPKLAVDRIYCRGLEIVSCQRLYLMPWRKLSDHVPLLAEFWG